MERQIAVIDFHCTCGGRFQFASESIARRARCPKCGTRAREVIGLAAPAPEPAASVLTPPKPLAVTPPLRKSAETKPPSAPSSPPPSSGEKPKITLRKSDEPFKPRPVSLPILDQPASPAEDDVVILLPMEEETDAEPARPMAQPLTRQPAPKPLPPRPRAPVPPPPQEEPPALVPKLTLQPSAQHQSLSIDKNRDAAPDAARCETHGLVITHACMNCGKALCMECVHQNGYYCGVACKAAYEKRNPRRKESKFGGKYVDTVFEVAGRLKVPAIVLVLAWLGYWTYANFIGVQAKVSVSMPVQAGLDAFKVNRVGPDVVICQAGDQLRMIQVSGQQELWRAELRPLEEKNMVAEYDYDENGRPSGKFHIVQSQYRDPLLLHEVIGDNVVVCSQRQLLVFGAKDGRLKWKRFDQDQHIYSPTAHEGGILCTVMTAFHSYLSTNMPKPTLVNYSMADGSEQWSMNKGGSANVYGETGESLLHNGHLIVLSGNTGGMNSYFSYATKSKPKPKPKETKDSKSKSSKSSKPKPKNKALEEFGGDELSSAMDSGDDLDGLGDEEERQIDETKVPVGNYTLDFLSLADGNSRAQKTYTLTAGGHAQKAGDLLCLVAGADLLVYDKGYDPIWKKKLSGFITLVAAGGDVIAVKTSKGVVALDAKTGDQKWVREGLPHVTQLHVAPDGVVYATLTLSRSQATEGEADDYRKALISTQGRPFPFAGMLALVKLNPKDGKTAWGVQFIGHRVIFSEKGLYVVDSHRPQHMLSAIGSNAADMSLRCLSTRTGRDNWRYIAKGELYFSEAVGKKLLVATATDVGSGNYQLQYVEQKW